VPSSRQLIKLLDDAVNDNAVVNDPPETSVVDVKVAVYGDAPWIKRNSTVPDKPPAGILDTSDWINAP